MRRDQVFVLLLIILIPMTGCFDNSVGDAEGAQDSGTVTEVNEMLFSVHIDEGASHSISLNGTTLKMEGGYYEAANDWRPIGSVFKVYYSIDCANGYQIEKLYAFAGDIMPVVGGVECTVEIFAISDVALIYSESDLQTLN